MSSFCDFRKISFCNFTAFFSFLTQANLCCFFQMFFILRSISGSLCPNINFDKVNFSERHTEEVVNFF